MRYLFVLLAGIFVALAISAGCMQQQGQSQPTTVMQTPSQVATSARPAEAFILVNTARGDTLADSRGKTVYYFATDIPGGGNSTCNGQCLVVWPAVSSDAIRITAPLVVSDFSKFTRPDGTTQATFRGWPLYYYQSDTGSGDVRGDGVNEVWFAVKPGYTVMIASRPVAGSYLTDSLGKSLYFFTDDTTGSSACTGACVARWPAFGAGSVVAPSLLASSDFSTITRPDGAQQVAYKGRPLYYFADDKKPGDMLGQGVIGKWFVANITGSVPAVATTVTTTVPTTTRTPYSRSYGGGGGY